MARTFVRSSSEYLINESAVLTAAPCTFACFFNSASITVSQALIGIGDASATNTWFLMELGGAIGGDPIRAFARESGTNGRAETTAGYSADTDHHACTVFTSTTLRAAFLDGINKGTNTDTITPSGLDRTTIGVLPRSALDNSMDGDIWEAGIWNAALSDNEVAMLANGFSPLLVRRQNLILYVPLVRDIDRDIIGGLNFSVGGTPTVSPHRRIIYPGAQILQFPPVAAVGGVANDYYYRMNQ